MHKSSIIYQTIYEEINEYMGPNTYKILYSTCPNIIVSYGTEELILIHIGQYTTTELDQIEGVKILNKQKGMLTIPLEAYNINKIKPLLELI